jgi:hypothetical protein
MAQAPAKPSYRGAAFTHWLNLVFLAAGGLAGAFIDPMIWVGVVALDGAMLWIVPDLPPFKIAVDRRFSTEEMAKEREYYLQQLWGLRPFEYASMGERVKSWFLDVKKDNADDRVVRRGSREFANYLEMRTILAKLRELVNVRGVKIAEQEVTRLEQIVNGYLRLLIACAPLDKALESMDSQRMGKEVEEVKARMAQADPTVRLALAESLRLKQEQLARLPKMQATRELLRTRAEATVHQLRNIHSQVLADPGMNVNAMLDEMIERREMLADPIDDLASDQLVREYLQPVAAPRSPALEAARAQAAGAARASTAVKR